MTPTDIEVPCAFSPNEMKKRLDPFERTELLRRAQEQLKQPWLEMLKRLFAEQHHDHRAFDSQAAEIARLTASVAVLTQAFSDHVMGTSYKDDKPYRRHCLHCDAAWNYNDTAKHEAFCPLKDVPAFVAAFLREHEQLKAERDAALARARTEGAIDVCRYCRLADQELVTPKYGNTSTVFEWSQCKERGCPIRPASPAAQKKEG